MLDTTKKNKRKRDYKIIKAMRKSQCERCGRATDIEPHHVFTVGSGGMDIAENLIQLCPDCHIAAHSGGIARDELLDIIARREGSDADEVYRTNRRAMGWTV